MAAKSSQFLKFADRSGKVLLVEGECIDDEHYNEIDISDWDWSVSDPSAAKKEAATDASSKGTPAKSVAKAAPGQKGDKISPSRFRFSKRTDKSTVRLLSAMDKGEVFPVVELSIEEEYQKQDDYVPFQMKITLSDAFVVDVDWRVTAADARVDMEEDWELNYREIRFDYLYRGKDGKGWIPAVFKRPPESDESGMAKSPPSASEKKAENDRMMEDWARRSGWTPPGKK